MYPHAHRASAAPPFNAPYPDAEWIARIRAGDIAAFEALVHHYADPLCAFVYNHVRDTDATRELVQDLFLWIWRRRQDWDVRTGLTSYLYRAARNRAISRMRHDRVETRWREEMARAGGHAFDHAEPIATDAEASTTELAAAVARAVASLPERCRQVFTLNREHHLTYPQIAETLGISVKTVEVHMGRALSALRRQLADWAR